MQNQPEPVANLNILLERSYRILFGLLTNTTIHIDGQEPIDLDDPARGELIIDVSAYVNQYQNVSRDYELPHSMLQRHIFVMTLIEWILDPDGDLIIDYNPEDFGEDVEKSGCTADEIRKNTRKRPLNKLYTDQTNCTVCLEDFGPTEVVTKLNCAHVYHDPCIRGWLKNNRTCPLCVTDISKKIVKKPAANDSRRQEGVRRSKRLRGLEPDDE
jgi:hypothetical protein